MKLKLLADVTAIVGNVVGALLVACNLGIAYAIIGYAFFLAGSIATIWLLLHSTASRSLVFTNAYFLVINIIGIVTRVYGV